MIIIWRIHLSPPLPLPLSFPPATSERFKLAFYVSFLSFSLFLLVNGHLVATIITQEPTYQGAMSVFPTKKPTHDQCCVVAMSTTTATASAAASTRSKVPPLCSPSITPNQVSIHLRHFFPLCAAAVLLCLASAAILCFVLAVPLHFALHFPFPSCNFFLLSILL